MAIGVLDVVGEDPEEQHVGNEVPPAGMQEHVDDEGEGLAHGVMGHRNRRAVRQFARHHAPAGGDGL